MENVWIVADDLTGAADTGVKFAQDGPVRLISLSPDSAVALGRGPLAVNTETRNAGQDFAAKTMESLRRPLEEAGPAIVYKKLDSVLRGLIGFEIAALMRISGRRGALVAPAYPDFDRVTVDGVHLVKGRPVSNTEAAKDPLRPVLDSKLSSIVSAGHDFKVAELKLSDLSQGPGFVIEAVKKLLNSGEEFLLACDARSDGDLAVLAEAGLALKDKLVLAGSAGLAGPVSEILGREGASKPAPQGPKGPAVFFGGSASNALRAQLAHLAENDGGRLVTLDLDQLMSGEAPDPPSLGPSRPLIYNLPRPIETQAAKWSSLSIAGAFGRLSAEVTRKLNPGTIFLSGGDTAREVLKALGASDIEIRSELYPGVVHLTSGELSFLTKSGGFGPPDLLSRIWREHLAPSS
ncbi:MAG: four-carbon acid sugar kinase family protein [Deltaproteobacteria bacterium]|jgi:uncharacterized protein YgbK (DUF1537 family)|nr:four-carbon acid sugar kinase family protein [Deltaproteobacteria bacterium]